MALVVEDGTGLPNADSYISRADAIAYLTSRGNKLFVSINGEDQDVALRNATDYMIATYRFVWAGSRYSLLQNLDWPRSYVPISDVGGFYQYQQFVPFNIVPLPVQYACADLATRAALGPLEPDIKRVKRSVRVGPLAVEYDPYSSVQTVFASVNAKLAPYISGGGGRYEIIPT